MPRDAAVDGPEAPQDLARLHAAAITMDSTYRSHTAPTYVFTTLKTNSRAGSHWLMASLAVTDDPLDGPSILAADARIWEIVPSPGYAAAAS